MVRVTNDPVNVPKLCLLAIGTAIASLVWLIKVWDEDRRPAAALLLVPPAAALLVPLTISWIFSPYHSWSAVGHYPRFLGLIPYLLVIVFALLVAEIFRGRVMILVKALVWAAAVVAIYGLLQVLQLDPLEWTTQGVASSTLGNPNFTGGFLAIALSLVIGAWVETSPRNPLLLIAGGFIAACLVFTRSEGAWAAGIAGAFLCVGTYARTRWGRARLVGVVAAGGVALLVVAGVVATVVVDDVPFEYRTIDRRGDWWVAAVSMGMDQPLVGNGPNSFSIENPHYQPSDYAAAPVFTDDPHSVPLAFFASNGFMGLGWLVAVGLFIRMGWAAELDRPFVPALQGAAAAYLVQALVSVDTVALRTIGWTVVAALAATMTDSSRRQKKKSRRQTARGVQERLLAGVAVVAALVTLWWGARLVLADFRFLQAQRLFSEGDGTSALAAFQATVDLRPDVQYRREFGLTAGEGAIAAAEAGEHQLAEQLMSISRDQLEFTHTVPHVPTMLDQARLLERATAFDDSVLQASILYQRVADIAFRDPDVLLPAARFLISAGNHAAVEEILTPVAEELDHAEIWGLLAESRALAGDEPGARAAAERALVLDTNQTEALRALELLENQPSNS